MTDYLARSLAACASNGVTARAYESEPTPRSRAGSASGQAATARPPDPTEARCLSPSGAARAARLETDYALLPPARHPAVSARRARVDVDLLDLPAARIPRWSGAAGTRLDR